MSNRDSLTILQARITLGDPHVCSDARDRLSILAAIYEPLVQRGAAGIFQPLLATSWSLAEDARTWIFQLRRGVVFHNGEHLEAADVVASLARICDPDLGGELGTQGVYRSYLGDAAISAVDPHTIQIVTGRPMADLLDLLCEMPIVPRSALAGLPVHAIGSGPYRIERLAANQIELAAFEQHWAGRPAWEHLIWRAEPDATARIAAVCNGQADLAGGIAGATQRLVTSPARLVSIPGNVCVIIMCAADRGACSDPRVRRALNYATDVAALITTLKDGAALPSNGPLTPLHTAYDPALEPFPYDPAQARRLLAEAGYSAGLTLMLDIPATLPDEAPALAGLLQEQYAAAGITLVVRVTEDRPAYADMIRARRYGDLCCFDSSPLSSYRVLQEKLHSGIRGPWWQGYTNPAVDRLLDTAAATVDDAQRQTIYHQAYHMIHHDAPWIFLYNPYVGWAVGPRLHNWQPDPDGIIRLG
ncbi:MAG TPA: ABC transporter substrate-binding protein [Roseiflexaceae bacterium]|nr:ABC transporter substrate-binding protein [Roseiflexaceae bacterium]HMP39942.1 ABC transporter substrate-binding protein [Roseiflexaceae bacterium]